MMVPMAGGMNKRGGTPLGERRHGGPFPPPPPGPPFPPPGEACPVRHCWVADAADGRGTKRPGLLVEWRRASDDGRWQGRVVYAAALRPGRWALVEEWLPADVLTPR
jgi:hypothetical protein